MIVAYLLLLNAVIISVIAGYFSVIGLTTIFVGAFWPIVAMAASLEASKVVATSWLYRNWTSTNLLIKVYLSLAITALSLITSMGIFGYLSQAHTTHGATNAVNDTKLQVIDQRLTNERDRLTYLLDQSNQYYNPNKRIQDQIAETQTKIADLTLERAPLMVEKTKATSEIGPLIYVAELVYGRSDDAVVSKAVRMITVLIVLVFDPLALVMLIAANSTLRTLPAPPPPKRKSYWKPKAQREFEAQRKRDGVVEVSKSSIAKMEVSDE